MSYNELTRYDDHGTLAISATTLLDTNFLMTFFFAFGYRSTARHTKPDRAENTSNLPCAIFSLTAFVTVARQP